MQLKFGKLYLLKNKTFISQKVPFRERRRNHKVLIYRTHKEFL